MSQEKKTGINQFGVAAEIFAGGLIGPGILNGNPYELAIGGSIAVAPIAVDFMVKFREHRRAKQGNEERQQD